jgi:hypothetical protein
MVELELNDGRLITINEDIDYVINRWGQHLKVTTADTFNTETIYINTDYIVLFKLKN